ncbi:FkbM family methyltransferase [Mesorhizobium sp. B2-4-17]|uniref:FkbM family methyltransferase n=1 Tax=Mesorhizobium sp. B2-4-17 TaxID=2589932 RepID=UPI00112B0836|nr:FkbM family methyltransferase [Mesorhizobium sp. B2-4-17]TPK82014.1 FkbM family methyltransferase [Mesorhizobium sp. B2-4-17]
MIISYAQNFEDVILWRALKSVEHGFYIDIGAQDPVVDSVSLTFYEHGWRGVHVEPSAAYAAKIRDARPDEEVIEAAVGTGTGPLTLHEFSGTGLSTGDRAVATMHAEAGFEMNEVLTPVVSLQKLLDLYAEREIHWLKIDVEGMEAAVIESWGPSPVRPWIVVVESTVPLSTEQSHEGWDPRLKRLGYVFVYFDGLNRFYVSKDHPELKASFGPGPNYFDDFVLPASTASRMVEPMRQELATRDIEIARLNQHIVNTAEQTDAAQAAIHERDIEIARLNQHIVNTAEQTDAAQAAIHERDIEIARLNQHIVNTAEQADAAQAAIHERDAEIARLNQHIVDTDGIHTEHLTTGQADTQARDAEIARLHRHIANADATNTTQLAERDAEIARLGALANTLRSSTSWRLTAPVRGTRHMIRATIRWPNDMAHASRANVRLMMQHGLLWLRRRPGAATFVQRAVRFAPPLERHLLAFARANGGFITTDTTWALEPDPVVLNKWRKRLTSGKPA